MVAATKATSSVSRSEGASLVSVMDPPSSSSSKPSGKEIWKLLCPKGPAYTAIRPHANDVSHSWIKAGVVAVAIATSTVTRSVGQGVVITCCAQGAQCHHCNATLGSGPVSTSITYNV